MENTQSGTNLLLEARLKQISSRLREVYRAIFNARIRAYLADQRCSHDWICILVGVYGPFRTIFSISTKIYDLTCHITNRW